MYTTRPDTLFGATYMVLAPEHPLVDHAGARAPGRPGPPRWTGGATPAEAVAAYRARPRRKTDLDGRRTSEKTGVFTGAYARTRSTAPDAGVHRRLRADGLRHRRDHGRPRPGQPGLGLRHRVRPADHPHRAAAADHPEDKAYTGDGPAINSANDEISLNGLGVAEAKAAMIDWLVGKGFGRRAAVQAAGLAVLPAAVLGRAVPDRLRRGRRRRSRCPTMLPLTLPEVDDYSPQSFDPQDATSEPVPPLARADRVGRRHAGSGRRPEDATGAS